MRGKKSMIFWKSWIILYPNWIHKSEVKQKAFIHYMIKIGQPPPPKKKSIANTQILVKASSLLGHRKEKKIFIFFPLRDSKNHVTITIISETRGHELHSFHNYVQRFYKFYKNLYRKAKGCEGVDMWTHKHMMDKSL